MTEETYTEAVEDKQEIGTTTDPGVMTKIVRVVFRTLAAVVVGLVLGMGLYYGAIRLYREAIEPIQGYEDRILELESSLEHVTLTLKSESEELNNPQAAIEGRLATNVEALASVEALLNATQQDLRDQRRILSTVEELEAEMENMSLALGDLNMLVGKLEDQIAAGDLPAQRVQRTAVYLKAMTMLSRAQLELDRNNLGFAAEQVESARATMNELIELDAQSDDRYGDEELVATIIERFDVILSDLPGRPDVAGIELEAIWKLFIEALQPQYAEEIATGEE